MIALIALLLSSNAVNAAETVNCTDASGAWKVNFTLDGKYVSNLEFIFADQMTASFPMMTALMTHSKTKNFYHIWFDQTSYFDFSRIKNSPKIYGTFLIPQDPTGLENDVNCDAHQ
jgi:hypothetical protein